MFALQIAVYSAFRSKTGLKILNKTAILYSSVQQVTLKNYKGDNKIIS